MITTVAELRAVLARFDDDTQVRIVGSGGELRMLKYVYPYSKNARVIGAVFMLGVAREIVGVLPGDTQKP